MENAFLTVFNSSVSSCWMILAVILLRFLLINKVPKWSFCVLWGLVALRLACPISLESALSLIPSAQTVDPQILYSAAPEIHSGISRVDSALNPVIQETLSPATYSGANPVQTAVFSASVVWLGGLSVLLVYGIVSYFAVRRRIAEATRLQGNILECAAVSSPFVLGFLRPRIYLPLGMDPQEADCVIAHERAHIRRGDHWTKPLGFLLLAVHWFNPLTWLAYLLFCRDLELACDERVIRTMDRKQRQTYALTLLACGVDKKRMHQKRCKLQEANVLDPSDFAAVLRRDHGVLFNKSQKQSCRLFRIYTACFHRKRKLCRGDLRHAGSHRDQKRQAAFNGPLDKRFLDGFRNRA